MSSLVTWAHAHPLSAAVAAALLLATAALLARSGRKVAGRPPAAVLVASLAAMACTAYSADTSWRFAADYLGMASTGERTAMFGAAELALFSCALMARQNLRTQGAPGTPGLLVWVITGVQVIPAYSESGLVGGTVRAVVGPVLAALLWHLAMGIELRHARPGADSSSLPALLAREGRERLLSRLGLATRDRTAEQITRDRWTVKAVGLAAKLADMKPEARGRARVARRLSVAVGKAQAGASEEQRTKLLDLLAARRHAAALATIDLPSPWSTEPVEVTSVEPTKLDVIQLETVVPEPAPVVIPPVPALESGVFWDAHKGSDLSCKVTAAVPAGQARQMVTEVVTLTPADLRREARRLHREAVRSTRRPVTIKTLQDELGLSRRDATELRREVVMTSLVTGEGRS